MHYRVYYTANTLHYSYIYAIASYQSVVRLLHKKISLEHNAENKHIMLPRVYILDFLANTI